MTEAFMSLARKSLTRVGNSTGLILSPELLGEAGMQRGDEVMVQAEDGRIVITRFDPSFDALVAAADRFVSAHPNAIRKLAE